MAHTTVRDQGAIGTMAGGWPAADPAVVQGGPAAGTTDRLGEQGPSLGSRLLQPRSLLGLLVVALVLWVVARQGFSLDWRAVWTQMRATNLALLGLAAGVFYLMFPVRAIRWWVLLENVGIGSRVGGTIPGPGKLTEIMYRSWFANCITVGRLGDLYRGYLLKQAAGVSQATTLGTVVAERLLDLAMLGLLLAAATPIAFHGQLPAVAWEAAAIVLAVVAVAGAMLLVLHRCRSLAERLVPRRFRDGYRLLLSGIADSLDRLPWLVGLSAAGWLIEGGSVALVARAAGAPIPIAGALAVSLVGSALSAIPITPSGLGLTEAGMVLLLTQLGVDVGTAAAVTLLVRVISYWSIVAGGGLLTLLRRND